jgi:hypothetical protein
VIGTTAGSIQGRHLSAANGGIPSDNENVIERDAEPGGDLAAHHVAP